MERKINWNSGCYDEIELVYAKAESDANIGAILSELETMALNEAEESCSVMRINDVPITREMFCAMSEQDKEKMLHLLSKVGMQSFETSLAEGKITVTFTPHIQRVLGCTIFALLNRLEKLDGSLNMLFPKVKLELRVPLGAKKGLATCEMLIVLLYPWLSVSETSINTVSKTVTVPTPARPVYQEKKPVQPTARKKKSFLARLFGKK